MATSTRATDRKHPPVDPSPARSRRRASKARKSSRSARKSVVPSVKEQLEKKYRKEEEFWATLSKERQELERWTEERRRNREAAEEYAHLCHIYADSADGLAQDIKEYEESIARTAQLNEEAAQHIETWGQHLDAWGQANRDHKEWNDRCAQLNRENSRRLDRRRQELDEEKRITDEYTKQ
ncbi:hypothetical protein DENSPDRAFT_845740, partial [Dentipellis sp. KUC8613]